MASMEYIFNLITPYEEEKERFIKFMNDNAKDLFSNVGNVRFDVPHLQIRSIINANGKYAKLITELNHIMNMTQDNSRYSTMHKQEIALMLITESKGSFQRLMNKIKIFIVDFNKQDYQFNVVKYSYQNQFTKKGVYL